jgi:hypothetical protein
MDSPRAFHPDRFPEYRYPERMMQMPSADDRLPETFSTVMRDHAFMRLRRG